MSSTLASNRIETSGPTEISAASRRTIYAYIGSLVFIFPFTSLAAVPVTFMLKDRLHCSATSVSLFLFITQVPAYLGIIFGVIRDKWSPFGRRDQGLLLIFGPAMGLTFFLLAFTRVAYGSLLLFTIAGVIFYQLILGAQQGLTALLGQEHTMSGRLSTVWNVASYVPLLATLYLGGFVSDHLSATQTFVAAGFICTGIVAWGIWRPKAVFDDKREAAGPYRAPLLQELKRLATYKPLYVAVLICFLWNFGPGSGTSLQFYMTNVLHASDTQYGLYNAIATGAFIPTFLLYGYLCSRWTLRRLLFVGALVGIPQLIPLLFIHSAVGALVAAVPNGLLGGLATAGFIDLVMRCSPPGLEGAGMMFANGMFVLSARGSDLLGTHIYKVSGFLPCVVATTIVYAAIVPVLFLVPKQFTSTRDGEAPATGTAAAA